MRLKEFLKLSERELEGASPAVQECVEHTEELCDLSARRSTDPYRALLQLVLVQLTAILVELKELRLDGLGLDAPEGVENTVRLAKAVGQVFPAGSPPPILVLVDEPVFTSAPAEELAPEADPEPVAEPATEQTEDAEPAAETADEVKSE